MIIIIILAIVVLLTTFYLYKYYIKPKKLIDWYKKTLEIMGFNVLVLPYEPHKITLF
jgi:uncharacterized protein YoxC